MFFLVHAACYITCCTRINTLPISSILLSIITKNTRLPQSPFWISNITSTLNSNCPKGMAKGRKEKEFWQMASWKSTAKMPQAAMLRQILKSCSGLRRRSWSWSGMEDEGLPEDVPRGHFAVYVGEKRSRHIVPISWLGHPKFQCLLQRAGEEYGFSHEMGITLLCEEAIFSSLVTSLVWLRNWKYIRTVGSSQHVNLTHGGGWSGHSLSWFTGN